MLTAERTFWIVGALWLAGLAGVDFVSGGTQRPFLVLLLVVGGVALWALTEWRSRAEAVTHPRRRRR